MDNILNFLESYSKIQGVISGFTEMPKQAEGKTSTFIVTDECNLRCTYCYLTDKKPNRLSWEDAKKFIDLTFNDNLHLADIPKEERSAFEHAKIWDFVGGEPFLEPDLVFKIMDYIIKKTKTLPNNHPWKDGIWCKECKNRHKNSGYRFSFSTNGTLLSDLAIRKKLEKYKDLVSLAITIDGPKDMHDWCRVYTDGSGSFDDTMENWEWYKKTFPLNASTTKSTISHENIEYIGDIAKFFWEDLGMEYVFMNCVYENVWHKGDQLRLFDKICDLADYLLDGEKWKKIGIRWFSTDLGHKDLSDQKWCGAGTGMDAVGYDGGIYPCLRFKSLESKDPFKIGDVYSGKDKEKVSRELDVGNYHYSVVQKEVTGVDCSTCPISSGCSSCQAFSYDVYGRPDVKAIYICPMHKAVVFANMYLMGNILGFLSKDDRDTIMLMLDEYTKDDYFAFDEEGNKQPLPKGASV